jgi:hypothetical protein
VHTDGPLDVRGDDFDTALFVAGKSAAYFWSDFNGSIGQNLVRSTATNPPEAVQRFRDSVAGRTLVAGSIVDSFPELLSILAAGEYKLELEEMSPDIYVVDFGADMTNFYPGFGALIATQPRNLLREEVIRYYDLRIADGGRPLVVTLTGGTSWADFVIDGHHKLQAYLRSGVPIRRLAIIRLNLQPVRLAEVVDLIPDDRTEKTKLFANKPHTN